MGRVPLKQGADLAWSPAGEELIRDFAQVQPYFGSTSDPTPEGT